LRHRQTIATSGRRRINLQFHRIRVIDVIAETTAKGDHMITAIEESTA
jgi:hypothetical protein